jgi:hypothetical protein
MFQSDTGLLHDAPAAPPAAALPARAPGHRHAGEDVVLALVVAVSRLPFLSAGYGTDTDTWKLAHAAHAIARTGRYEASRLPGYPVQEWVSAALWRGGPVALNGVTALFSVAAALLLARLFRRSGARSGWPAALAFAFVPAVYVGSTAAIDYLWAVAFLLGAWLAALGGRPLATGVLLGLAVGSRITSACFLLPLGIVLWHAVPARRVRAVATAAIAGAVLGALPYVPVLLRYGPGFLSYYDPYNGEQHSVWAFVSGMLHPGAPAFPPLLIAGQATVGVWGIVGCVAVAVALLLAWRDRAAPPAARALPPPARAMAWAWTVAIVLVVALYVRLPHDEGYLIPAVPFVLLGLAALTTARTFRVTAFLIVLSSFVLGLDVVPPKKGLTPLVRSPLALAAGREGGERFVLDVLRGPALQDLDKRRRTVRVLDATLAAWPALPPHARVIAGLIGPALMDAVPLDPRDPRYFNVLTRPQFEAYARAGDPMFYLPDTRGRTERVAGYDPAALGARPLLPDQGP